jgi:hypothetical protein
MLKKMIVVGLILIQILLVGCSENILVVNGKYTYEEKGVSIKDMGNYFDVVLDYTSGLNCRQMGEAYARGILEAVPDYEFLIDSYLTRNNNSNNYKNSIYRTEDLKLLLNQDYMDEIEGMSSVFSGGSKNEMKDKKISKDELYLFNLYPDVAVSTQCSFVSVFGSRSSTGSTITGRNLDWYGGDLNELPRIQAVITYIHKNKKICSIGYLGYIGMLTGFSDSKVFAAVLVSPSGAPYDSAGKRSYSMDLRFALENNKTINKIAEYMKDPLKHYTANHLIALSDPTKSVVLENNFSGIGPNGQTVKREVRTAESMLNDGITWGISDAIGSVNSFLLFGNYNNHTSYKHNTKRWKNMKERLISAGKAVTPEGIKKVITYNHGSPGTFNESGDLYNRNTVQMILFQPESLTLEVFFRPKNSLKNPKDPVFEKIQVFQ